MNEEVKKEEVKTMKGEDAMNDEAKNQEVKAMENKKKETVTKEQKKEYRKCLNVFEHSTKEWVDVAEAYQSLLKLPKELWIGDEVMKNVKRPNNVGLFLKKKYDISQGRLSQLAGAYEARNQLMDIEGYEKISCNALYEIYRFVKDKDNRKKMTVKDVYNAIHAKGVVCENTVKAWRKQIMSAIEGVKNKSAQNVFERLLQAFDAVSNANNVEMTEVVKTALRGKCCELLTMLKNDDKEKNNLDNDSINVEKTEENSSEKKQEITEKMVNVA